MPPSPVSSAPLGRPAAANQTGRGGPGARVFRPVYDKLRTALSAFTLSLNLVTSLLRGGVALSSQTNRNIEREESRLPTEDDAELHRLEEQTPPSNLTPALARNHQPPGSRSESNPKSRPEGLLGCPLTHVRAPIFPKLCFLHWQTRLREPVLHLRGEQGDSQVTDPLVTWEELTSTKALPFPLTWARSGCRSQGPRGIEVKESEPSRALPAGDVPAPACCRGGQGEHSLWNEPAAQQGSGRSLKRGGPGREAKTSRSSVV